MNAIVAPPVVRELPAASLPVSVRVTLLPLETEPDDTETTDVDAEIAPGVTVTVGIAVVTFAPPIVAWIVVAVPARRPVKDAEYVPLPLSVTVPIVPVLVPPDLVNAIVELPVEMLLPFASLAWSVIVTLDPEATVAEETDTVDWAAEIAPGVTVTVGIVVVTGVPPMVALTVVAEPAVTPVNEAV